MDNLTPHPHANTIKEWALHLCSGAVNAGWYALEERSYEGWDYANNPAWFSGDQYRITMTDKHPDYKPPEKMIKVEFEISESVAEGFIRSTRTLGLVYYKDYEVLIASISKALADSK